MKMMMNEEQFIWRIWNKKMQRWYRSSYRSHWPTEGGAKRALGGINWRWNSKEDYEIVKFKLAKESQ